MFEASAPSYQTVDGLLRKHYLLAEDGRSAGGVYLSRQDSGICHGRAQLTNGDTYEFSVEFRATDSGCCGTLAYPVDASPPVLVDGGQD